MRILSVGLLLALLPVAGQAAVTRGSLDRPPYYDGKLKVRARPVAHVPVTFRFDPASLDPTPGRSAALAAILDSLQAEIDRLGLTTPLSAGGPLAEGPDVAFGCRRGGVEADGTPRGSNDIDPTEPRRMSFEVEDPSRGWRRQVGEVAPDSVRGIVCVQLGFGEYWVRQKNWKGAKVIDLGTGRAVELPWLTSLDDPVQVLQLTGALVSPAGRVLRVGAEGLLARRTGMMASTLGAQEVLTEEEIQKLMEPPAEGSDPVWRSALRELVLRLLEVPALR